MEIERRNLSENPKASEMFLSPFFEWMQLQCGKQTAEGEPSSSSLHLYFSYYMSISDYFQLMVIKGDSVERRAKVLPLHLKSFN
jgi:hypothetical protein